MIKLYIRNTLISFIFLSCSVRSGQYVFKNGEWAFEASDIGFLNHHKAITSTSYYYSDEFMWPVPSSRKISSYFGMRGNKHHDGIDIPARRGANILCSMDGKVIFSGKMRGYGKVVVVKHENKFHTVYAHNSKNFVKKGQRVSAGEVIALIGNTGRSSGNHLHFEIRRNNINQNPMAYFKKNKSNKLAKNTKK